MVSDEEQNLTHANKIDLTWRAGVKDGAFSPEMVGESEKEPYNPLPLDSHKTMQICLN